MQRCSRKPLENAACAAKEGAQPRLVKEKSRVHRRSWHASFSIKRCAFKGVQGRDCAGSVGDSARETALVASGGPGVFGRKETIISIVSSRLTVLPQACGFIKIK